MWRYIFNNLQVKVAMTVDAETDEQAWEELKKLWETARDLKIDLPPVDTFGISSKNIL